LQQLFHKSNFNFTFLYIYLVRGEIAYFTALLCVQGGYGSFWYGNS
jgi:hypothetical protein